MIILRIFLSWEILEDAKGFEILEENRARQVRFYSFMLKLNENIIYNLYIKINFPTFPGLVASNLFFFLV